MKPRVFILMHYLELGGAETSLIGLLQAMDPGRVSVDLFLCDPRGEMLRHVPGWVRVLPVVEKYAMVERPMLEALRKGHFLLVAARLLARLLHRIFVLRRRPVDGNAIFGYVGRLVTPLLPSLRSLGTYDLAISFLAPHDVVMRHVSARKKLCWIHTDYSRVAVNAALELPVWASFHHIVSISPSVTSSFLGVFPSLEGKIMEMENILPARMIRELSVSEPALGMERAGGETLLLTIGRYSYPKRLDEIPLILRLMRERGAEARWFIIGYGGSGDYIRDAIQREGMQEYVTLLGKRANPYPYLLACDWYVQPSRYEGKSVTVREAQLLHKPVIITDFPTASSQLTSGEDGLIVPMPAQPCAEAMARAIADEALRRRIIARLSASDHSGASEVEKLYSLIL